MYSGMHRSVSKTMQNQFCYILFSEITRVQSGQAKDKLIELHNDKPTKIGIKVKVPQKEFPKVNRHYEHSGNSPIFFIIGN